MPFDPPAIAFSSPTMRGRSNACAHDGRKQPKQFSDFATFVEKVMTKSDIGLLKRAAKAVRKKHIARPHGNEPGLFVLIDETSGCYWNPLSDDGEAFRLAMQLNLSIVVDAERGVAQVGRHDFKKDVRVENHTGLRAAARRAIVKAASKVYLMNKE